MKIGDFTVTFGADPELAVYDEKARQFISPYKFLPGTKKEPYKLKDGACQVDGFAAEFNVDPCEDWKELHEKVVFVRDQMSELIKKNAGDHIKLKNVSQATIDRGYFDTVPEEIRAVGCSPDYNSQSGKEMMSPIHDTDRKRYFGGHVHVGWTNVDPTERTHFIECCALGYRFANKVNSWSGESYFDVRDARLSVYGFYRFRPKPYGIELRAPSNSWVGVKTRVESGVKAISDIFQGLMDGTLAYEAPESVIVGG